MQVCRNFFKKVIEIKDADAIVGVTAADRRLTKTQQQHSTVRDVERFSRKLQKTSLENREAKIKHEEESPTKIIQHKKLISFKKNQK